MKRAALLAFVVVALVYGYVEERGLSLPGTAPSSQGAQSTLQAAYRNRQSDLQVQGEGMVTRILPDDLDGSRHQKFILKVDAGQTVLVAHNIDLAPRISDLKTGDSVAFYGEYEWNDRGGVIHWTHHDPNGYHIGGWLKHKGRTYQ